MPRSHRHGLGVAFAIDHAGVKHAPDGIQVPIRVGHNCLSITGARPALPGIAEPQPYSRMKLPAAGITPGTRDRSPLRRTSAVLWHRRGTAPLESWPRFGWMTSKDIPLLVLPTLSATQGRSNPPKPCLAPQPPGTIYVPTTFLALSTHLGYHE